MLYRSATAFYPEMEMETIKIKILRKRKCYRSDPSHVISRQEVEVLSKLSYEEQSGEILVREVKELRNKYVSLLKVLWRNHAVEEATWETEESSRKQYPHLFEQGKFRRRNFLNGIEL